MKKRKAKRRPIVANATEKNSLKARHFQAGFGYEMPPQFDLILIYFDQKRAAKLAMEFYLEQEKSGWKTIKGAQIKNWKVSATEWLYNYYQAQRYKEWKNSHALGDT